MEVGLGQPWQLEGGHWWSAVFERALSAFCASLPALYSCLNLREMKGGRVCYPIPLKCLLPVPSAAACSSQLILSLNYLLSV